MSSTNDSGPGALSSDEVGSYTIANTTALTSRISMAYAAGINDENPAYFDDTREAGLDVHPAICFALQWNARHKPDFPVNHRAAPFGVHAETDLRIHKPFPAGAAVTIQGQQIKRQKIRPGVYTVDRFRITDSMGALIAELDYNSITRGATLEGGDKQIADIPTRPILAAIPETPLWQQSTTIKTHAGQQYTECARIFNPIHTEPSVAIAAGLPNIILHGSATKAIALSNIVDREFDGDSKRVTRLYGQLKAFVLMNTDISVECLGVEVSGAEKTVYFQVRNSEQQLAIANGILVGSC